MPIQREFLGWSRPALPVAAEWLLARSVAGQTVDLRNTVVAVPGERAGRRLLEIVVDAALERSLELFPPRIVTVGMLPELLYEAKLPFAHDLTQQLAWVEALRSTPLERLAPLLRDVPDQNDLLAWLSLGEMLARIHRELAAEALDFKAVVEHGRRSAAFETPRWLVLAELQQRYLGILDSLELWDLQTARLFAIEHRECATEAHIVLAGTVDMVRAQRAILDQVADRVTALVFAPPELAGRFDPYGCLLSESWQDAPLDISAEQIELVEGPAEQADAVARAVAAFDGRYSAEEISIGVPDKRVAPYLEQRLEECDLPGRNIAGAAISQTAPYQLLRAVADHLASGRFHALAALLRHPAIEPWLCRKNCRGDWLSELDEYFSQCLPGRLARNWLARAGELSNLRRACAALQKLLRNLSGRPRPLADWAPAILELLVEIYGGSELDQEVEPDRRIVYACESIRGALQEHAQVPARLAKHVTAVEALRLVLRGLEGMAVPPRANLPAIELLGWLELPLDDAPALIVTGFNEGIVPSTQNSDLFLPNELRRQLKLQDNDRRYARDAYALSVLAASRAELRLIAGRRTADGDPLAPSRLLFCCDDEQMAERARALFAPPQSRRRRTLFSNSLVSGRLDSALPVPKPKPLARPVTSMKVTEFRDYLACPYRYYLRHRLSLAGLGDAAEELDAGQFGSLLHDVLGHFAAGPLARSTDSGAIQRELSRTLDHLVKQRRLERALPAVRVQIEQLRRRLAEFASWQAPWARDGWAILHAEISIADGAARLDIDGQEPMFLRGRIDRIDVCQRTGEFAIFDYKTGDSADPPERTHRKASRGGAGGAQEWTDLQLPLYRHLARSLQISEPVTLGYIVLPKDVTKTACHLANWTADDLAEADEVARSVVRNIRQELFWPQASVPPAFCEQFAAICQDGRLGGAAAAEDAETADDEAEESWT